MYQGKVILYVFNQDKAEYLNLSRQVSLPFKPEVSDKIRLLNSYLVIRNVLWHENSDGGWCFTICVSEHERAVGDTESGYSFLDLDYFVEEYKGGGFREVGEVYKTTTVELELFFQDIIKREEKYQAEEFKKNNQQFDKMLYQNVTKIESLVKQNKLNMVFIWLFGFATSSLMYWLV